nr:hypothetical protein GCM10020063_048090 [Dactylosporangium thailandense]
MDEGREVGESVLTARWLAEWATQLQMDDHQVGPPASDADLALLRQRMPWTPDEIVALHRHVGPVSLPDIGNGYFIHALDGLPAVLDQQDRADQIGGPFAENIDVVVFGSNGGGDLYAMAVTDGRVFRLRDAAYLGGVYDGTARGITVVGADLRDFLERLLSAVTAFAVRGDIIDL